MIIYRFQGRFSIPRGDNSCPARRDGHRERDTRHATAVQALFLFPPWYPYQHKQVARSRDDGRYQ